MPKNQQQKGEDLRQAIKGRVSHPYITGQGLHEPKPDEPEPDELTPDQARRNQGEAARGNPASDASIPASEERRTVPGSQEAADD